MVNISTPKKDEYGIIGTNVPIDKGERDVSQKSL